MLLQKIHLSCVILCNSKAYLLMGCRLSTHPDERP